MTNAVPSAELMRSLGRLVRGLSALFWGLPLALVVCVQTARTNLFAPLGVVPPVLSTALLLYALLELGHFQAHERIWRQALDRTKLLALVNLGLSPFLYWWKILPSELHFQLAVAVLGLSGLLFLFNLNQMLQRLAAMLPDETLRLEARMFTNLNLYLVLSILLLVLSWVLVARWTPPPALVPFFQVLSETGLVLLLLLVLLPVAMTMALIWKIKELILASIFGQNVQGAPPS